MAKLATTRTSCASGSLRQAHTRARGQSWFHAGEAYYPSCSRRKLQACSSIAFVAEDDRTEILGPLERRVMARLWAGGPQTVGEVLTALNAGAERRLAYTTVMTILMRLHEKGYVSREKESRHYGAASLAGFAEELAGADSELVSRLRRLADAHRRERQ
jgi:predicted transcriptional regulator